MWYCVKNISENIGYLKIFAKIIVKIFLMFKKRTKVFPKEFKVILVHHLFSLELSSTFHALFKINWPRKTRTATLHIQTFDEASHSRELKKFHTLVFG